MHLVCLSYDCSFYVAFSKYLCSGVCIWVILLTKDTITLSIGVKHLSFMDDLCGTLVLNDVIGHSPDLYV